MNASPAGSLRAVPPEVLRMVGGALLVLMSFALLLAFYLVVSNGVLAARTHMLATATPMHRAAPCTSAANADSDTQRACLARAGGELPAAVYSLTAAR